MVDSRGDTEMLKFFIGYCSGHFIFPVFLNPLGSGLILLLDQKKGYIH